MPRDKVFVSYSRRDRKWCETLERIVAPLADRGLILLWIDRRQIKAGDIWKAKIREALNTSKVGVLLVSKSFLSSTFIRKVELPELLQAASRNEVKICWLLLSACSFEREEFTEFQAVHDINQPLNRLSPTELVETLTDITTAIADLVTSPDSFASWHRPESSDACIVGLSKIVETYRHNLDSIRPLDAFATIAPLCSLSFFCVAVIQLVRHEFAVALWILVVATALLVIGPLTRIALTILEQQLKKAYWVRSELTKASEEERNNLERAATDMVNKTLHISL